MYFLYTFLLDKPSFEMWRKTCISIRKKFLSQFRYITLCSKYLLKSFQFQITKVIWFFVMPIFVSLQSGKNNVKVIWTAKITLSNDLEGDLNVMGYNICIVYCAKKITYCLSFLYLTLYIQIKMERTDEKCTKSL